MKLRAHQRFATRLLLLTAASQSMVVASPPSSVADPPEEFDADPHPTSSTEIPFRISDGYLIVVEGSIGTRHHLKFLIDTGASISIVDSAIADTLELRREPTQSFNFDRTLTWEKAAIPELRFGPILAINTVMLVGPLAKYSEFARKIDAVIGLDLLHLRNFTIDSPAKKLIFDSLADGIASARDDGLINGLTIYIGIQGYSVRLMLDTGLPGILLFEDRLLAKAPDVRIAGDVLEVTLGERLHAKRAKLRDVAIGETTREMSVLLTKAPPPDILPGIDGIVGLSALNARRVHFNFLERTVSWE